jgi:hypothetical protein
MYVAVGPQHRCTIHLGAESMADIETAYQDALQVSPCAALNRSWAFMLIRSFGAYSSRALPRASL